MAPCTDCGAMITEAQANNFQLDEIGDWVCEGCASARSAWRNERDTGDA